MNIIPESNLPTLLQKKYLVPPIGSTDKEIDLYNNTRPIDYILYYISNRIPEERSNRIKIIPATFGDKVIILKSKTGSGKSTVLPAKLYTAFFHRSMRNIICTQPRIITAIDIPNTLLEFNSNLVMGRNIGYNTQSFKALPIDKGLIFSTVGILLMELMTKTDLDFIKKYQFIVIDEVHNRDLDVDRVLYMLKKFLQRNYKNPMCPMIILMSATIDEEIFKLYYEVPERNYIQVEGSAYVIEENFPEYSITNYVEYITLKAQHIHLNNLADIENNEKSRDIIIFVKDSGVGKKIQERLHLFNAMMNSSTWNMKKYNIGLEKDMTLHERTGGAAAPPKYFVLPIILDSRNFSRGELEYQYLFSVLDIMQIPIWKLNKGEIDTTKPTSILAQPSRRIIIATDVAETGITIESLKYCIDTGYRLSSEFFPEFACSSLISKNASYGSAMQRRGRVGRKAAGFWYPIYTKDTFDSFGADQITSIIRNDTTTTLLTILILEKNVEIVQEINERKIEKRVISDGLFQMHSDFSRNWFTIKNNIDIDVWSIDFMELPSIQSICYSLEKLHILGFIDSDLNITLTGYYANKFRFIGLELIKMILAGYCYGSSIIDLITIAAFVYVQKRNIFEKNFSPLTFLKSNADINPASMFNQLTETQYQFYSNVLIADDFIACVFIFNALQEFLQSRIGNALDTIDILEWCKIHNIKFTGLCDMLEIRDVILESMVENGLDINYNGRGEKYYSLAYVFTQSLVEGLDEIKKFKQCVYEGFKLNALKHIKFTTYRSLYKNIPIKVKSPIVKSLDTTIAEQEYPMYVVCDSYSLVQKFDKAQFEFIADNYVSVLDNFIIPDSVFYSY